MSKEFLDELKEELENLKDSEAKKVYEAIENHEFPPIPLKPTTVAKTVNKVVMNHEVTADELLFMASQRDVTLNDLRTAKDLAQKNEENMKNKENEN